MRLYLYDKDQKLVSVNKYTSADALKAIELEKGNYTVVLVGNVPEDGNISSETIGTPLSGMSVQLTKAEGATHYTPLGDVMFAKSTLTVDDKDLTVGLSVKRTLSATKVQLTDYSGQISDAGVLVPGVGTMFGFGDDKWTEPGTVFVTMKAGAITKAAETGKQYSIFLNVTIVNTTGEIEKKILLPGTKPDRYWLPNCWKCLLRPSPTPRCHSTYPSNRILQKPEKSMFLSVKWR